MAYCGHPAPSLIQDTSAGLCAGYRYFAAGGAAEAQSTEGIFYPGGLMCVAPSRP